MNICLDQLRKKKHEAPEETAPEQIDGGLRQDDRVFAAQRRLAVDAALETLPPRQRAAIGLCHYQELTNIEAADIMGVSIEALESLLARGRRALRERLAPMREDLMGKMDNDGTTQIN